MKENTPEIDQNRQITDCSDLREIGIKLRIARENKGLSIEEIANKLHIGVEQLSAIENGDEDLLPEKVFIQAMIKRVSEKLAIEDKESLRYHIYESKQAEPYNKNQSWPRDVFSAANVSLLFFCLLIPTVLIANQINKDRSTTVDPTLRGIPQGRIEESSE